jgi:hypothetical protein
MFLLRNQAASDPAARGQRVKHDWLFSEARLACGDEF